MKIKDWLIPIYETGEMSIRLRHVLDEYFLNWYVDDLTRQEFLKKRNAGLKSWTEFQELRDENPINLNVMNEKVESTDKIKSPFTDFQKDLAALINTHSLDNTCNTPDWILAEFLTNSLKNFEDMVKLREAELHTMP